jgi:hypothetical protein
MGFKVFVKQSNMNVKGDQHTFLTAFGISAGHPLGEDSVKSQAEK